MKIKIMNTERKTIRKEKGKNNFAISSGLGIA